MPNEFNLQELKEDYPEFFAKSRPEIIDFILSEKTSRQIADICIKNGVADEEKIEAIAYRIVWVVLDRLPSENLALTLELGVKLTPETAKKVADEANQFISSLITKSKIKEPAPLEKERSKRETTEEEPKRPLGKDVYREQVE